MIQHKRQTGFTVIELMISTTIFSVILLLCSFAILQIGRTYYKGINSTRTQSATRSVSDNIAQSLQFSGGTPVPSVGGAVGADLTGAGSGAICIGSRRYSYVKDRVLVEGTPGSNETRYALVVDNAPASGACPSVISGSSLSGASDPRELVSTNMRISELRIENTPGGYEVSVALTTGPFDLSDGTGGTPYGQCEGGTSSQFCAYSRLTTLAKQRL